MTAASSRAESPQGVVIVSTATYSEARNAGVKPGDVLLSWSRGTSEGAIQSPFDLMRLEIEQAPFRTVTIYGLSGSQKRTWILGQGDWAIKARPNFTDAGLQLFRRGRILAQNGKIQGAYRLWQSIANRVPQQTWIVAWCVVDAAESMTQRKRWIATDMLYREALAQTKKDPTAEIFLTLDWVRSFEERQQWDTVTRLLQKILFETGSVDAQGLFTASALSDLARVDYWRRDIKGAEQLYLRALVIDKKLVPESLTTARTLIMLATVALNRSDETLAQAYLDEAKPIIDNSSPQSYESARFIDALARLAKTRGDFVQAKEDLIQAKGMLEAHWPDSLALAGDLNTLAFISGRQGDFTVAEEQLSHAMDIYKKSPDDPDLGFLLKNNLAVLTYYRGDFANAEKYERQTEAVIAKLAPDSTDHAGCLLNLGLDALENHDLNAANAFWLQGLAVIEKVAPRTVERAGILNALSWTAIQQGNYSSAAKYASSAQQLLNQLEPTGIDMAETLRDLAHIAQHAGKLQEAEKYLRQSLVIKGTIAPESADYAEVVADLAELLDEQHKTEQATKEFERAINVLEGLMARLGGNEAIRSQFRERHEDIYKRYIDVLVRQGKVDQAFEILERSRARTLLELLAEANVQIREHIEPSLRAQEQILRTQFAAESDRRLRLLTGTYSNEQLKSSDAIIAALLDKFAKLQTQIHDTDPGYAALTQPATTTVEDVRDHLLDVNTVLLEYSLGEKRSYLWLISSDSVSIYVLPGRVLIEKQARRVYRDIATSHSGGHGVNSAASSQSSVLALAALSRMILGPVERQLGQKRLLIVADGALNYIPFSALPVSSESVRAVSVLVTQHEIVSLPSASVLMTIREEHTGRQSPPRAVAVLADPVFDFNDPRLKRSVDPVQASAASSSKSKDKFADLRSAELTRTRWAGVLGLASSKPIHFSRLVYSRREAQAIAAASPRGEVLEALDFSANRKLAMSPDLAEYKIVHFATHGLIDTTHPEFSGLLLSLYDKDRVPEIGLLSLEDIYNLNLPIDMVVLSACETALGKEVNGEGLIGLTRGFMYAGASRVVASLWNVNDVATASLMGRFYHAMAHEHLTPAAALREAQLEMHKDKRWTDPYYWAGFQLQGEWK